MLYGISYLYLGLYNILPNILNFFFLTVNFFVIHIWAQQFTQFTSLININITIFRKPIKKSLTDSQELGGVY